MEWLVKASEEYRSQLRQGPFFKSLARAERPNDLQWIHQLIHQSREFTQALCLRYSLCHDRRYQPVFAEHALEEADHPDQLIAWMKEHGFLKGCGARCGRSHSGNRELYGVFLAQRAARAA